MALEEPDVLQLAELELEVAALGLEAAIVEASPLDGRAEVALLELCEYAIHLGELVLQVFRVQAVHLGVGTFVVVVVVVVFVDIVVVVLVHVVVPIVVSSRRGGVSHGGRLVLLSLLLLFPDERRSDGELALAEQVHGYGAVDERRVVGHGVRLHGQVPLRHGLVEGLSKRLLRLGHLFEVVCYRFQLCLYGVLERRHRHADSMCVRIWMAERLWSVEAERTEGLFGGTRQLYPRRPAPVRLPGGR